MSRHLPSAAVVPAAPLVLSRVSPAQPAESRAAVIALRRDIEAVVAALPEVDAYLLVAAGPRGLHDAAVSDLRELGITVPPLELPVAKGLLEDLTRLTQYPLFRGEPLSLELAILIRVLGRVRGGDARVVPVSVPDQPDAQVLRAVGASLHEALEDVDARACLLAAGDLSAGLTTRSPAYAIDGAATYDGAITSALEHADLGVLDRYGPQEAARVVARGWAPMVVAAGAASAARLRPVDVAYHAPRGVGGIVARFAGRDEPSGGRFEIDGGRTGVLEKQTAPQLL